MELRKIHDNTCVGKEDLLQNGMVMRGVDHGQKKKG